MHHRVSAASRVSLRNQGPVLLEQWITSAGLPAGEATWTGTVAGTVLTKTGTLSQAASGGTNPYLVFPGTTGNYMSKTDGIGPLPSGTAVRTVVLCGSFGGGRYCGFSWGEPVGFKAFTLGVQGNSVNTISADYYNSYDDGEIDDVVSSKGSGIWFMTLDALGAVRLYHGDQLIVEDLDPPLNTGSNRINLMRPYGSGAPGIGSIGCIEVYDGALNDTARQAVVDRLNPLYLGLSSAPTATSVAFTATSPTTGNVTATLPVWRSVLTGVMTSSATKPSVAQIDAHLNHLGNPAPAFTHLAMDASAAMDAGVSGLTGGVTQYPHYYMRDAYGHVGTVQTGTSGATPTVGVPTSITPTAFTFSELVIAPTVVATLVANVPATFSKVSGNAAFTVSSDGSVNLVSNLTDGSYSFVAMATSVDGPYATTINVTVADAPVAADLAIRFGALTPTGSGGAQARNPAGDAVNFTSITSQPSTRWTLASGKLVATGSPAMASEQITAVVAGATVAVNLTVVPNMISVADATEYAAVSMTPAGTGDFTIHLRAGVTLTRSQTSSKICGTSGAHRVLGGTLTLTGETVRGAPAARVEGITSLWMDGGRFEMTNLINEPADGRIYSIPDYTSALAIDRAPTTDVLLEGLVSVGHPSAIAWPGRTAATSGNDMGHDPWGALVRVNTVSGSFRPYVDGQVGAGPDILTFGTSGVKRVLMGMHSLGAGVYEMQFGDRNGNHHSVDNGLVTGEHTSEFVVTGETVTGIDGGSAVVMAAPTGVDTAGGRYMTTGPCYTYLVRGATWLNSATVTSGSGFANTVKNLTVRNCDVSGGYSLVHPYAINTVILEQNKFHHFSQDCIKIANRAGPNYELIIRRNDIYSCIQSPSDLGAEHTDYMQIVGATGGQWVGFQLHHNRFGCFSRGCAQGLFNTTGTNTLVSGSVFGNIWIVENGGWGLSQNLTSDSVLCHNTLLINQKAANLPAQWAPNDGDGMLFAPYPITPNTNNYVGWNITRRYQSAAIMTEKNFGIDGTTSKTQLEMVAGLGATKPTRPMFFETFDELMAGTVTILAGADEKAGARSSVTNWTQYPYYVTTTFAHITAPGFVAPVYNPGTPSTLALGAVTATGGTSAYTGSATVVTPGGAIYYSVCLSSVAAPSAAQVQAGKDGTGAAATVAGTVGASTAGVKSIGGAIAPGSFKIYYAQVNGATVSPVAASSTMTVTGAGIYAINAAFTYNDSTQAATPIECPSFTPTAGEPLLITVDGISNTSTSRSLALKVTIGTAGRADGTGTVLTPLSSTYGSTTRGTGAAYGIEVPSLPSGAVTVQVGFNDGTNADTRRCVVVRGWSFSGAHQTAAFGVTAAGPAATTLTATPGLTTSANGAVVVYNAMVANGASLGAAVVSTSGATVLGTNVSTGAGAAAQDHTTATAWETVTTSGTAAAVAYSWPESTTSRWSWAVEVKTA